MKYSFLFLVCLSLFFSSCKEDEGAIELNFLATYDGQALVLNQDLAYESYPIRITESDFYISNIQLKQGAELIDIKDIDFVDFTNQNFDQQRAEDGYSLEYDKVPAGTYDGLVFSIGVPPSLNSMVPANFESSSPLSKTGYYWDHWSSYIFAKLAGVYETEEGEYTGYFFHTGTDDLYRTFEINREIVISEDQLELIQINLDHKTLFSLDNGSLFDISSNSVNHDPLKIEPLEMLVNNYAQALNFN